MSNATTTTTYRLFIDVTTYGETRSTFRAVCETIADTSGVAPLIDGVRAQYPGFSHEVKATLLVND